MKETITPDLLKSKRSFASSIGVVGDLQSICEGSDSFISVADGLRSLEYSARTTVNSDQAFHGEETHLAVYEGSKSCTHLCTQVPPTSKYDISQDREYMSE